MCCVCCGSQFYHFWIVLFPRQRENGRTEATSFFWKLLAILLSEVWLFASFSIGRIAKKKSIELYDSRTEGSVNKLIEESMQQKKTFHDDSHHFYETLGDTHTQTEQWKVRIQIHRGGTISSLSSLTYLDLQIFWPDLVRKWQKELAQHHDRQF